MCRRGAMDPHDIGLIVRLCAKAGMIMEDARVSAITIGRLQPEAFADRLRTLSASADQIAALVTTASAINEAAGAS